MTTVVGISIALTRMVCELRRVDVTAELPLRPGSHEPRRVYRNVGRRPNRYTLGFEAELRDPDGFRACDEWINVVVDVILALSTGRSPLYVVSRLLDDPSKSPRSGWTEDTPGVLMRPARLSIPRRLEALAHGLRTTRPTVIKTRQRAFLGELVTSYDWTFDFGVGLILFDEERDDDFEIASMLAGTTFPTAAIVRNCFCVIGPVADGYLVDFISEHLEHDEFAKVVHRVSAAHGVPLKSRVV
jgi:hypothetical protein